MLTKFQEKMKDMAGIKGDYKKKDFYVQHMLNKLPSILLRKCIHRNILMQSYFIDSLKLWIIIYLLLFKITL